MPRHADPNAKDALVAAARAEFAKRGLRGARIEDITAACGLSKGAFYLHFKSKEALFGQLVDAFREQMGACAGQRDCEMASFVAEEGAVTRRDFAELTARYQRFLEMETSGDLRILELIWEYRDVVGVLLRGAQGTRFEGTIWEMTDREVDRIKLNFDRMQVDHACRTDIPAEIFGSLIVGAYVLLGARMSRMAEKPDLAEWARSLHVLVREGSTPVDLPHFQKSVRSTP
ncbi:MAG TPA: helix-turn-helix domain-containing protein [Myxococcales bacterium]